MTKKRSIRDVLNDLDKLKEANPDDEASKELFKKIEANRRREGYISPYQCLVDLNIIEDIIVPDDTVNLFPYMQKKQKLVNEALKDPTVKAKVEAIQADFKEQCKREGVLYEN